jgi:DNA-directed RNA polymerase subunit RPC12/RpoP
MNCFYCDAQVVVDTTGPCEHSENYETEESISCPDCGSIYLVWRGKEEISNDS